MCVCDSVFDWEARAGLTEKMPFHLIPEGPHPLTRGCRGWRSKFTSPGADRVHTEGPPESSALASVEK